MYQKGFKFKLYPSSEQKLQLEDWFGQSRFVYNQFLAMKKDLMKAYKIAITSGDLSFNIDEFENFFTYENMTKYLKKNTKEKYSWLKSSNSQPLQQKLMDLHKAFEKMFNEGSGFPKFKSKKYSRQSIRFPQISSNIKIGFGKIKLPKMTKELKFGKLSQIDRIYGNIKNLTISKESNGDYFISFMSVLSEEEIYRSFNKNKKKRMSKKPKKKLGIDLGIKSLISDSNGNIVDTKNATKDNENKLKKLNRQHSKKKDGSKNKEKSRLKLAKLHQKIANIRLDYLHKTTTKIIRENQTIVIENLNVAGMIKNRKLSKSIANASWGEFRRQLEYKAKWYSRELRIIDRFYPSSQLCSEKKCEYRNRDLNLSIRDWMCPSCGKIHDRDLNAAINIRDCDIYKVA